MEHVSPELQLLRALVAAAEEDRIDPGNIYIFQVRADEGVEVMDVPEAEAPLMSPFRALEREGLFILTPRRGGEFRGALTKASYQVNADTGGGMARPPALTARRDPYIAARRIEELRAIESDRFDLRRLVQLCVELNSSAAAGNYVAMGALQRTILHHVPPVFGHERFESVAAQASGRSFKKHMDYLLGSMKNVADEVLHLQAGRSSPPVEYADVDSRVGMNALIQKVIDVLS